MATNQLDNEWADAKEIVRTVFAASARGDLEAVLDFFTEDAVIQVNGAPGIPFVGRFETPERRRYFFTDALAQAKPEVMKVHELIADGDQIVALGYFDYLVHSTGRHYYGDFALHLRLREGRIAFYQMYEDSWCVAEAFDRETTP